jgi:hypothetical protein
MLQAGRSRVRFPIRSLDFLNLTNPSSRTMALRSTQPLTEMSTSNLPGGKGWSARKTHLTAIWADYLENVGTLPTLTIYLNLLRQWAIAISQNICSSPFKRALGSCCVIFRFKWTTLLDFYIEFVFIFLASIALTIRPNLFLESRLSPTHTSHKHNVINCSSVPGNPFRTITLLNLNNKMEEN